MVVSGIVKKDVNEPLGRIHQRDRYQQRDRAQGVNRRRFESCGLRPFPDRWRRECSVVVARWSVQEDRKSVV